MSEPSKGLVRLQDEVCAAAIDFAQYAERDEMNARAYDAAESRLLTARFAVFAHKITPLGTTAPLTVGGALGIDALEASEIEWFDADASQWTQVRRYNGDMVIRYWRGGEWSAWSKNVDLSRRDYTSPARLVSGAETDRDPTARTT